MTFNAISHDATARTDASVGEQPFSIDDVFGWLARGTNDRGVILCGTHGYEQHCAHRSWRALAHRIAATGCTTLRFDYPDMGDSGDRGGERPQAWIDTIRILIRFLRDTLNLNEVVLVGLRLGGTFAALAPRDVPVERIILLAPFATGHAFLRDMTLQARMVNVLPDGASMPDQGGVLAVGGFALKEAFASELAALALTNDRRVPAAEMLLMGAARGGLAEFYRDLGVTVTAAPFPDLAQLCANALKSRLSEETASIVADFAAAGAGLGSHAETRAFPSIVARIAGPGWSEKPIRFGHGLTGIACGPDQASPSAATVLFLNMGVDVHSGFGRQTTDLARILARSGIESLRMDLRSAGDSADHPSGRLPLYDPEALDDVYAAIDVLAKRRAGPIILAGTCHGAYLAFHAICQDHRVQGAVMANLYCFDWNLTHNGTPYSETPIRNLRTYAKLLKQRGLRDRLRNPRELFKTILRGTRAHVAERLASWARQILAHQRRPVPIAERIAQIRRRHAHLALLYSEGDLGLVDLHAQLGQSAAKMERLLGRPVEILPKADHSFTAPHARLAFLDALIEIATVTKQNEPVVERAGLTQLVQTGSPA